MVKGLAIDNHRGRHLDVGVVEGHELLLPVVAIELQEDRSQGVEVVHGR